MTQIERLERAEIHTRFCPCDKRDEDGDLVKGQTIELVRFGRRKGVDEPSSTLSERIYKQTRSRGFWWTEAAPDQ